jgi:hypothetical protein
MPGMIAAIQTFGDRINFRPHLHFLVTEGGVDESGVFHKISRIDDSRLTDRFAREVLGFLIHKVLAFISDFAVVDRIIDHLKLTFVAERPPLPHLAYQEVLITAEAGGEYFS